MLCIAIISLIGVAGEGRGTSLKGRPWPEKVPVGGEERCTSGLGDGTNSVCSMHIVKVHPRTVQTQYLDMGWL